MNLNLVKMARDAGFHVGDQFAAGCSEDDLRKLAAIITVEIEAINPPQRKPLTEEQEREAFEAWARQDPLCWGSLARTKNGAAYRLTQTDCAWNGWSARAAHGIKK